MCGRYSIVISEDKLRQQFGPDLQLPRGQLPITYNMAPTREGPVITNRDPHEVHLFRWGLVPFWSKDNKGAARMINARREGIEDKPAFRQAIRERRCLVLADSFYEWRREGSHKRPYRILPADGRLLIMAGIWESWRDKSQPDAPPFYSYSIITGAPNAEVAPIHDRMPMLLLDEERQSVWLDAEAPFGGVLDLLHAPPDGTLKTYEVSTQVNNVRNDGAELHQPLSAQA